MLFGSIAQGGFVVRLRCGHIRSKKRKWRAASNSAWAALPAGPSRQEERGAVIHGPDETSQSVEEQYFARRIAQSLLSTARSSMAESAGRPPPPPRLQCWAEATSRGRACKTFVHFEASARGLFFNIEIGGRGRGTLPAQTFANHNFGNSSGKILSLLSSPSAPVCNPTLRGLLFYTLTSAPPHGPPPWHACSFASLLCLQSCGGGRGRGGRGGRRGGRGEGEGEREGGRGRGAPCGAHSSVPRVALQARERPVAHPALHPAAALKAE